MTQENVGSAGGWHRGIQHALDNGFDAVWLMDDDGFPEVGALKVLEEAMVSGVACASSVVVRDDDPTKFVFPFPVLDRAEMPVILGLPRKITTLADLHQLTSDGTYPFAHLFNGALVSLKAVRQVGNVNQDYFIYGDEVDYFFRLRKAGLVISVLDAMHYHPDVSKRPFSPVKVYYYVKNSLILNSLYCNDVWLRQASTLAILLVRMARRNGFYFLLSMLMGRHKVLFYSAIYRGLWGKVGADFNV